MTFEYYDLIGFLAASLTTTSFIPQALKVIRTKHTKDLSLTMYVMFVSGVFCWGIYGLFLGKYPIIAANIVTLIFSGTILVYKVKEVRQNKLSRHKKG